LLRSSKVFSYLEQGLRAEWHAFPDMPFSRSLALDAGGDQDARTPKQF
jgi:hypothetical protein